MSMHYLDAKGLRCPMPIIKLQQLVRRLQPNDEVEMICTDPGAEKDVQSWCKVNHHRLIEITHQADALHIKIQIKSE